MTHNRFNVEQDLVKPLQHFLNKAKLDLNVHKTPRVTVMNHHARTRSNGLPVARKTAQSYQDVNFSNVFDSGRMIVDQDNSIDKI